MLAILQPADGNLPLFLHVLGAVVVFGATGTVAIAGFAAQRRPEHRPLLASTVARTLLFGVLPAWILMRVGAEWIRSKEFTDGADEPGWLGVGYIVSDGSGVLLIVTGILAWISTRRGRVLLAVPILATICVIGFAAAWVAMSGKP
ncbi:MAG TPA: hypothetical protein VKB10_10295 [Gaiellaceae bacterium]|nr:hypothetical protein [Gaiellaceae bacterium]